MIAEQLKTGTQNEPPKSQFYFNDAKIVSKTFIKFPDVVQVGVFGGVARYGISQGLELAVVVSDEKVFRRFVELVQEYHLRTQRSPNERQVRLAAFDVVFGRHNPTWPQCQRQRTLDLRHYIDLVVLPFDWQNRLSEIGSMLDRATPCSLTNISSTVTWLQTQV